MGARLSSTHRLHTCEGGYSLKLVRQKSGYKHPYFTQQEYPLRITSINTGDIDPPIIQYACWIQEHI